METWKFKIPEYTQGKLLADDIKFFYEDIAYPLLDRLSNTISWNKDTEVWAQNNSVTIDTIDKMPKNYNWESNTIYIKIDKKDRKDKAQSLMRHLRNSFAHFRVIREQDSYKFKDQSLKNNNATNLTMIGCIKVSLLRELILKFIIQMEGIREKFEK